VPPADEAAFASLLDAWSGSMLRLARGFVSTDASAEEVVQDTWLAVIRGIDGFRGTASLSTISETGELPSASLPDETRERLFDAFRTWRRP
jgi:hypothetical protein